MHRLGAEPLDQRRSRICEGWLALRVEAEETRQMRQRGRTGCPRMLAVGEQQCLCDNRLGRCLSRRLGRRLGRILSRRLGRWSRNPEPLHHCHEEAAVISRAVAGR